MHLETASFRNENSSWVEAIVEKEAIQSSSGFPSTMEKWTYWRESNEGPERWLRCWNISLMRKRLSYEERQSPSGPWPPSLAPLPGAFCPLLTFEKKRKKEKKCFKSAPLNFIWILVQLVLLSFVVLVLSLVIRETYNICKTRLFKHHSIFFQVIFTCRHWERMGEADYAEIAQIT